MWWTRFRDLTRRQRLLAAVLIAIILAAGIYRIVAFGDVNNIHGGSTVQSLTGKPETFPTTTEVEADARSSARDEGKVRHVACKPIAGGWTCSARFAGGLRVVYQGVWVESERRMVFSVKHWKASVHFTAPVAR
jgi:hypothetical protein